jgi:hypothetical protein
MHVVSGVAEAGESGGLFGREWHGGEAGARGRGGFELNAAAAGKAGGKQGAPDARGAGRVVPDNPGGQIEQVGRQRRQAEGRGDSLGFKGGLGYFGFDDAQNLAAANGDLDDAAGFELAWEMVSESRGR